MALRDSAGELHGAFRISEAADYFGVSTDTVRRLIKSGELAHARVVSSITIPVREAARYLAEHTTTEWVAEPGRGVPSKKK